ncbi:hypothetical protein GGG87_01255 [Streptococcus sp. zg-86]|uniref:UDP-N-acetylglucosamine 1-carboxyvinyltransferase n=1 Tax=Streptococcus zhangguiae TaxID=2664091 RepID=A0A6I4RMP9_9STRE|nr:MULTISPECIES: hypothetical protein [unclassified Streptococcus]MTB63637.1 hypothetical protein [Streptococcus sp. zg-86]MTB89714.1 hypothetical protein [Streptococcus sp. zg-36]MWV55385.1 hypothetical protein [Streptococcus sp. zg-70]QTH47582.1 hypothetical protein J5M87_08580 [Streptococcus sp. zg-86]
MTNRTISYRDEAGNLISAADIWTVEKLEELFTQLNPKRLERRKDLTKTKDGQELFEKSGNLW